MQSADSVVVLLQMHGVVESCILAAVDIHPLVGCIRSVVRTVQLLVKDSVMVMDIVEDREVDMKSSLGQRRESDTGLMMEECGNVDNRYIQLCFPCICLWLCSYRLNVSINKTKQHFDVAKHISLVIQIMHIQLRITTKISTVDR